MEKTRTHRSYRGFAGILVLGLLVAASACQNGAQYTEELNTIERLQSQLDSAEQVLRAVELEPIREREEKAGSQLRFIQQNWPDSMERPLAGMLSDYYMNKESLEKYLESHEQTLEDLEFTQQQLRDLDATIRSGQLPADSVTSYLKTERTAAEGVVNSTQHLDKWITRSLHRNSMYAPQVDSLVREMNRNGVR